MAPEASDPYASGGRKLKAIWRPAASRGRYASFHVKEATDENFTFGAIDFFVILCNG